MQGNSYSAWLVPVGLMYVAAALAGCAGGNEARTAAAAPPILSQAEAKSAVLTSRSRVWRDPESIRDAAIGQPYTCSGGLAHVGNMPNACVCVEANARNAMGGYVGLRPSLVMFAGRQVVDVMPPRPYVDRCGPMTPFPELNGRPAR